MKTITRHVLWGGLALGLASLTLGTGSACGYAVNNYVPEEEDVVQTADGSFMPSDAGNSWRPTGPYGNIPDPRVPRGPFNPGNIDDPTQAQGWGVYCIRKQTSGSTHVGVLADMHVSDSDGINEMGLMGRGNHRVRFLQVYPASTEAAYEQAKKNYGLAGNVDLLSLYVVDDNGDETEFPLKIFQCEALDKLLETFGKGQ